MNLVEKSNYFLKKSSITSLDEIRDLQDIIREHNSLYYNQESPVISDMEYDNLFKLLKKSEEELNIFDPNSPTKRIDVLAGNQFQKGTHISPMISLDNTYDSRDILDFEKRITNILKEEKIIPYIIELKFDGLGISITYKSGKLIRVLTRGNGIEGEDVTVNALQIKSIPKEIPYISSEEIEIRGEVVMPISSFTELNRKRLESGEKLFANPRNAASGSLRQIDYNITKDRNLDFYAYSFPYLENGNLNSVISSEERNLLIEKIPNNKKEDINSGFPLSGEGQNGMKEGQSNPTYFNELDFIKSLGFQISPYLFEAKNINEVVKEIEKLTLEKPSFDFEIDGLVLKVDDLSLWQKLGTTEHHPRYAIAYKFPATNVRTQVLDIEHSVGRTGVITPIAHLEPVNVGGVIVRRATLHNYDELAKKDVRIGDSVFIVRAGEVIPEVISVILESRTGKELEVFPPEKCPSCESILKRDIGKIAWFCPNKKLCPAQTLGSLISFVSKHGANIEGLGDKIIEIFIEKGYITDFTSIYKLERYSQEILNLEGFKDKKLKNILDEVESSRNMNLANFFVALGIPQVGKKTGKILANYILAKIDSNTPLVDILFSLNSEKLQEIKDIGPIGAHSIVYYFEDHEILVKDLLNEIKIIIPQKSEKILPNGKLSGKSFCVTGSFLNISRDEIHSLIEDNSGEIRTSVTSKLDYLIVGTEAGSKLTKAQELGVKILGIDDFYKMI
ncbi:MAG: NAD-dependent DNA ligase LigA [Candidatus Gracilibacteria bacterium]|nr:NAD-dependent DNA ligase LigA [Candidatus Gracilibacteria bacterium]MDD2908463.1 NAD-dependent DNA ligase LigA [Candidatus Gracilibacteria bacterium]